MDRVLNERIETGQGRGRAGRILDIGNLVFETIRCIDGIAGFGGIDRVRAGGIDPAGRYADVRAVNGAGSSEMIP